jgi:sugar/nucleoside kinase (ribokinase family)
MKILVAGELNPDLILSGLASPPQPGREILAEDFALQLGSSSAIVAAGLARLGNTVSFRGKVGADSFGRFSVAELEKTGVDCRAVIVDPALKTGVTVSLSGLTDRALVTFPGAIASLAADEVTDELLREHRHLHVASYYLQHSLQPGLGTLFARAHALGLTTSLDPGCDPSGSWSRRLLEVLRDVDVFLVNEVELEELAGNADVEAGLRRLSSENTLAVAKLGARGCAALDSGVLVSENAIEVTPVDTTGAGDSFDAGFLHAWLRGMPLRECLRCGTVCGGLSTLGLGGTASQPSWEQAKPLVLCHTRKQ